MRELTRSEKQWVTGVRLTLLGILVTTLVGVYFGWWSSLLLVLPVLGLGILVEGFVLFLKVAQAFRSPKDIARERREMREAEERGE